MRDTSSMISVSGTPEPPVVRSRTKKYLRKEIYKNDCKVSSVVCLKGVQLRNSLWHHDILYKTKNISAFVIFDYYSHLSETTVKRKLCNEYNRWGGHKSTKKGKMINITKLSKLWSSQLWTQFKLLRIVAWKSLFQQLFKELRVEACIKKSLRLLYAIA